MTTKEYLNQARNLDDRINSKIQQMEALNELATKATSVISDMPGSPSRDCHKMERTICKIIDLEWEINDDIDRLVDIKRDIMTTIKAVEDKDCQTLLEKRYLCGETWEEIASEMNYTIRYVHILHGKAISLVPGCDWEVCE